MSLLACSSAPKKTGPAPASTVLLPSALGQEVVLQALALIDTGYTFGGANPEAGLDCSGLVRFVYGQAAGIALPHNAAQIAELARAVSKEQLRPGDLVFFNTLGKPKSHVGIYIGDGRFVHAPNSRGKVRVESMNQSYYLSRFEGGGTLLLD
ncbi:C40 family peptidase [Chitinilyticum piscinae]|nr:C40 family peptidase [Chitinilyticum piscinae]